MMRYITYCGLRLEYECIQKNIKNAYIRIKRDGEISVSAPFNYSVEMIDGFVEQKAEWIFRKLADYEKSHENIPDDGFYEGKTVYILGHEYTLKFERGSKFDAFIEDGHVVVEARYGDENLKPKYISWLAEAAKPIFDNSLTRMLKLAEEFNINRPEIYVRNMTSRWGSCNTDKHRIGLNVQLMKADIRCIDHVVLHELVHFVHPDHSPKFYAVLDRLMPDWRDRKKMLEANWHDGIR